MSEEENINNSDKNSDETNNICVPEEVKEAISKLPENERKTIIRSLTMSFRGVSSPFNPMVDKMTQEHITLTLQNAEKESERDFKLISNQKLYDFLLVVGALIFVLALCYVFRDNISSIKDILIPIATFVGGYGFGKNKR